MAGKTIQNIFNSTTMMSEQAATAAESIEEQVQGLSIIVEQ